MDKLEAYLEQVCRGIAGPRSLRQHIRRELAEHLRDAAAGHEAAGMSKDEALAKALEDFGGPEQMRAELEDTHGHRLMTVVVDKALQWKEMTMKAKWIWSTWAHVMLALVLAAELAFIFGCVICIYPKFIELARDGWIDTVSLNEAGAFNRWGISVIWNIRWFCFNGLWLTFLVAVIWALFEWRVRSENKTLMRLAAMGTGAVGLAVAAFLTGAALILPLIVQSGPSNRYAANQVAKANIVKLDDSMKALDAAIAAQNWEMTRWRVNQVWSTLHTIWFTGLGQPLWDVPKPEEGSPVDAQFLAAISALREAEDASRVRDSARFDSAMQTFRQAYGRLRPGVQTAPKQ